MPRAKKDVISEEVKKKTADIDYARLQERIIENLIDLQKVHTNMAEKFDKLSEHITSLLTLFELAARSFAEHPANQGSDKDKEFLEKIDRLLDQNKTIAKGLTLMEERVRERLYGAPNPDQIQTPQLQPLRQIPREQAEYQSSEMNELSGESGMGQPQSNSNKPLPKF